MINYQYKDSFLDGYADKQLKVTYNGGNFGNEYIGDFSLIEKLCSASSILFGSCESSYVTMRISNLASIPSLKNEGIQLELVVNEHTENPLPIGTYKVISDEVTEDKNYRDIKAYDGLYDVLNTDYFSWYDSLNFPLTLKDFRDAFFNHIGITQETVELVNDDMTVNKVLGNAISGAVILNAICEINGVFGHIDRNNIFKYISIANSSEINIEDYASPLKYEDYVCESIGSVHILNNDGDIGVKVGEGVTYTVTGNFLCFDKTVAELQIIAQNMLNNIINISYIPIRDVVTYGNPCYEVGDIVNIYIDENRSITSYIFERVLSNIQGMRDSYSAKGTDKPKDKPNSLSAQLRNLEATTNIKINRLDEGFSLEVQRIDNNLSNNYLTKDETMTVIEETAGDIKLSVTESIEAVSGNLLDNSRYLLGFTVGHFWYDTNGDIIADTEGNPILI